MQHKPPVLALVSASVLSISSPVSAQPSFGLDDHPAAPLVGPIALGNGAEDPLGFFPAAAALAPSPSLGVLGALGDGSILGPGPFVAHPGPNGFYVSAFSRNHPLRDFDVRLLFSVDRATRGQPTFALNKQVTLGQAHGDMYSSAGTYLTPFAFVGVLPPAVGFAGVLPAFNGPNPGNLLVTDESVFGLRTPLGVVPPLIPVPGPFVAPGQHDNLDSYDKLPVDRNGDGLFDGDHYFAIYPGEAFPAGVFPADIFAVAAGTGGAAPIPYATGSSIGLIIDDSIDALIMYDRGMLPIPVAAGGPGFVEPGLDYALFSLAPGSPSLNVHNLDGGDVFFTDFRGSFALYARGATLGLNASPPGFPYQSDNVDALDLHCPGDLTTTGSGPGTPGFGIQDCRVDLTDLLFYVNLWSAGLPPADITTTGTALGNSCYSVPDTLVDLADLLYFVNEWQIGMNICP